MQLEVLLYGQIVYLCILWMFVSRLSIFISFYCSRLSGQTNLQHFGIGTLCVSVVSRYSSNEMDYSLIRNAKVVHQSPLNNS